MRVKCPRIARGGGGAWVVLELTGTLMSKEFKNDTGSNQRLGVRSPPIVM